MDKIRKTFLEVREGFLDAKSTKAYYAFYFANVIFIIGVGTIIILLSSILLFYGQKTLFFYIAICTIILCMFFHINTKAFVSTVPFSSGILTRLFGRYGRVVTKKDWENLKKYCPIIYKDALSDKSNGHCYFYSWAIALYLKNAKIMYCGVRRKKGDYTGHAVIVKKGCVYDTNRRQHYDLKEYKKMFHVKVYKLFSRKEYATIDFFDNIRRDFADWCEKNNIYCDPQ